MLYISATKVNCSRLKMALSIMATLFFSTLLAPNTMHLDLDGLTWQFSATEQQATSPPFDELTIRKKMRIYELEIQKAYATNGSLWISDSCSGDRVEKTK